MRRAIKYPDSKILTDSLKYASNNSLKNKKIAEILWKEQKGFCAYTDDYIDNITTQGDVEHFNPTLKNTPYDSYDNWFFVSSLWNKKKGYKWNEFQPVLYPIAADFEERIVYEGGDYFEKTDSDIEAKNLIDLLQLDHPVLASNRKRYIRRKRADMKAYEKNATDYFIDLVEDDRCDVKYPRAIKEEFGVDVLQLIY